MGVDVVGEGHGNECSQAGQPDIPAHVPLREAVPQKPPKEGAGHARNSQPEKRRANIRCREVMGSDEEGRNPVTHSVPHEGVEAAANGHVAEALPRP